VGVGTTDEGLTMDVAVCIRPIAPMIVWGIPGSIDDTPTPVSQLQVFERMSLLQQNLLFPHAVKDPLTFGFGAKQAVPHTALSHCGFVQAPLMVVPMGSVRLVKSTLSVTTQRPLDMHVHPVWQQDVYSIVRLHGK